LVVAVVYIGMLLSILAFVFAMPIGTLIATSGVFAIILGLALQNTLSDVFSGIALNLGRPYTLGDWIILSDGTEGRVVETNWRSTHLLTLTNNVVALPNSFLAKLGLTNVSRPDESHGLSLTIRLVPTKMPAAILDLLHQVLMSCNSIVKDPPPSVAAKSLDASAMEVALYYRVSNVNQRNVARNEIYDLVYRYTKSTGLLLAMPYSASLVSGSAREDRTAAATSFTAIELIKEVPIFAALMNSEKEALAAMASVRNYLKGEIIVQHGESLSSLMIVQSGTVVRLRSDEEGREIEIGYLAPGDFFGETGLLAGVGEVATLRAMTHVVLYEIDQQSFGPLLLDRPEMAEDLAAILATRIPTSNGAEARSRLGSKHTLLNAIKAMFHSERAGTA
jgi:CRP-like cAMP-binding protein